MTGFLVLAAALAQPAAAGSDTFQTQEGKVTVEVQENPNASRNVFGRLERSKAASRMIKAGDAGLEDASENAKTLYEGRGGSSGQVLSYSQPASDFYDRLTAANLTGYSPDVLAIQNALNRRRPAGAPKLAETGRLDAATLAYPAYEMRHDLESLRAGGAGVARLERLSAAIKAFEAAAGGARGNITLQLVRDLGARRQAIARMIVAAWLEAEARAVKAGEAGLASELKPAAARLSADYAALAVKLDAGRPEGVDAALKELSERRRRLNAAAAANAQGENPRSAEPETWWRRLLAYFRRLRRSSS